MNLSTVLHAESRTGTGGRKARAVRRVLVVAQVAFAFVLLIGSGLLLASFRNLLAVDPGFKAESVITAGIGMPRVRYPADNDVIAIVMTTLGMIALAACSLPARRATHVDPVTVLNQQ